ncbi:hypothetical protein CC86DRAFT_407104 [Ophiobolus disseminans]|uniref:Uncharacterized protein n=1 Tax=Ophiobolus disseminans TaxID=1469910 RepID=A0A6A6ZYA6_9PLEO|nr:hypothetical protein CC86DRAFT_407104 [Ophiobolus disseminans]
MEKVALSRWVAFTNQLVTLKRLTISNKCFHRTWENAGRREQKALQRLFLPQLSLPDLCYLSLANTTLQPQDLSSFQRSFPKLVEFHVVNVAILAEKPYHLKQKTRVTLWYRAATRIRDAYGGRCVLSFGQGPFLQSQGRLDGWLYFYSHEKDPVITSILKPPVLTILSAVARSTTPDAALRERYLTIMKHTRPKVIIDLCEVKDRSDDDFFDDCDRRVDTVESEGLTAFYHEVVRESSLKK